MQDNAKKRRRFQEGGSENNHEESSREKDRRADSREDGPGTRCGDAGISAEELESLREEAAKAEECFERLIRLKADFENYRKRTNREREEYTAYAVESVVSDFLEVVDNLERALSASGETGDFESLRKGVEITHKDAMKVLENWGVKEVAPLGDSFDPEKHEAVEHVDSDETGKVVDVLRKGYLIKEKLIRPALVKVGRRV